MRESNNTVPIAFLGALAAASAYGASARADVVAIVMDRSGSMAALGAGALCGSGDRKWVCAITGVKARIDAQIWAEDNSDDFYYFKFSQRFPGSIFEQGDAPVTAPVGPLHYLGGSFNLPDAPGTIGALLLSESATGGPTVDDSSTPLAGAYCQAARFLLQARADSGDPDLALDLQLGSDGLENSTPLGELCQGDDSPTPFVGAPIPVLPRHDFAIAGGAYTQFDGLTVPSWEANMLDVAISGGAFSGPTFLGQHVPATDGVAFEPPAPGAPNQGFFTNVTFIDDFADTSLARAAAAGPDAAAVARRARAGALAAVGDPDDPATFFNGIVEARGGRIIRSGSGDDLPADDPLGFHPIAGDANSDGCVDELDANAVELLLGEPVSSADPDTFAVDVNLDGRIDEEDFLLVRRNFGAGCDVDPGPAPVLDSTLFGFEDSASWSSTVPLLTTRERTAGSFGLSVGGQNWREVLSVPFDTSLFSGITSKIAYDVRLTETPANRFWLGQTQLFVSCPSAGIFNAFLGAVELTGKPLGAFSKVTFNVPQRVRRAMQESHSDFTVKVVLNSNDPHVIDNLRFVP